MRGSTRTPATVVAWRPATIAALAYGAGAGFFAAGFLGDLATKGRAAEPEYRTRG
jgi:anti-sigma factor RsiW